MHYDNYNLHCVISIHALLAESDGDDGNEVNQVYKISIHALLAESDPAHGAKCPLDYEISIHALLAESDGIGLVFLWWGVRFLSTLSLRRATQTKASKVSPLCISIHALLAESDTNRRPIFFCQTISIHALLAESDLSR